MCYKSPGPRCQGHAIERVQALSNKAGKEWQEVRNVENELETLEKNDPQGYKDSKEYKKMKKKETSLREKWKATGKELQEAKEEVDATKGGIADLKSKIAKARYEGRTSDDAMHLAHLQNRLAKGEKTYHEKALAYDKENGTVDTRKPSPYGSKEGVSLLNARAQKAIDKAKAATSEEEADKYRKQAYALVEQTKHARLTKEYAEKGICDPFKATLATDKIALDKVTKKYDRLYKENTEWRKNWEQGDYKKLQDFRKEALTKATRSRWTKAVKEEEQRLVQQSEASRYNPKNKGINMMELAKERDKLKARVSWAEKSPEERAETVRRNNRIAADYGKGPGSWTGD